VKFFKYLYVAPLGCTEVRVQDAVKSVIATLLMRGHIGEPVSVYSMDLWDGHYTFKLSGCQDDVEHVLRVWQTMDEERIG
jgi:hypothetical protein